MTELTKKIGINTASPTATLHVVGPLLAKSGGAGINAVPLLRTTGGKGGATTGTSKAAGRGAAINITAGDGGNAPEGGKDGSGGNVVIKPGASGTGGAVGGASGKVLIAPDNGNVGVGTFLPSSKLTVVGQIESQNTLLTPDGGFKYPDGTVQTTAFKSSDYVKRAISGHGAIGLTSFAANSCHDLQLGIGGIQPGDLFFLQITSGDTLPAGLNLTVLDIPAAGTVNVRVCNSTNTASVADSQIGVIYYAVRP